MDMQLNSMLDFLVETQFNESFTKKEIDAMNSLEKLQKKMSIRNTFILCLDKEVLDKPVIVTNFNRKIVEGNFYPDNYIGDKPISNR